MNRTLLLVAVLVLSGFLLGGKAPLGRSTAAMQKDRVCALLAPRDDTCANAIELLGQPFLPNRVSLRVVRRMRLLDGEQVMLGCEDSACLPFFVFLHNTTNTSLIRARSGNTIETEPFNVRPGAVVKLVQQSDGVRLTRSVVCLERGRLGDVIRVRESNGRKVFRATVVQDGEVSAAY